MLALSLFRPSLLLLFLVIRPCKYFPDGNDLKLNAKLEGRKERVISTPNWFFDKVFSPAFKASGDELKKPIRASSRPKYWGENELAISNLEFELHLL